MKKVFIVFCFICLLFPNVNIFAVTANPDFVLFTQPDGSILTIGMKGDEFVHWAVSIDGYTLLPNDFGTYEYAILSNDDKMILSGIQANDPQNRSFKEINFLNSITPGIFYTAAQVAEIKEKCLIKPNFNMKMGGFPTTGTRKLLLILANFNNTYFQRSIKCKLNNLVICFFCNFAQSKLRVNARA